MSDSPNRFLFPGQHHTSAHDDSQDQSGSYIHLTHAGGHPTQTSHPGGFEVHIKVDYRVDKAGAMVTASRHTMYYFWPRDVDATHGLREHLETISYFSHTHTNMYSVQWPNHNSSLPYWCETSSNWRKVSYSRPEGRHCTHSNLCWRDVLLAKIG